MDKRSIEEIEESIQKLEEIKRREKQKRESQRRRTLLQKEKQLLKEIQEIRSQDDKGEDKENKDERKPSEEDTPSCSQRNIKPKRRIAVSVLKKIQAQIENWPNERDERQQRGTIDRIIATQIQRAKWRKWKQDQRDRKKYRKEEKIVQKIREAVEENLPPTKYRLRRRPDDTHLFLEEEKQQPVPRSTSKTNISESSMEDDLDVEEVKEDNDTVFRNKVQVKKEEEKTDNPQDTDRSRKQLVNKARMETEWPKIILQRTDICVIRSQKEIKAGELGEIMMEIEAETEKEEKEEHNALLEFLNYGLESLKEEKENKEEQEWLKFMNKLEDPEKEQEDNKED